MPARTPRRTPRRQPLTERALNTSATDCLISLAATTLMDLIAHFHCADYHVLLIGNAQGLHAWELSESPELSLWDRMVKKQRRKQNSMRCPFCLEAWPLHNDRWRWRSSPALILPSCQFMCSGSCYVYTPCCSRTFRCSAFERQHITLHKGILQPVFVASITQMQ